MNPPIPLLILGLGNTRRCDDGAGALAADLVAMSYAFGSDVQVHRIGQAVAELVQRLGQARHAILLDAVRADAPPGSLVRLDGAPVEAVVRRRVANWGGDDEAFAGRLPKRLTLLGVVPADTEPGVRLSPSVEAALPTLVRAAGREVRARGWPVHERIGAGPALGSGVEDLATAGPTANDLAHARAVTRRIMRDAVLGHRDRS